jgi:CO/xanthine dehydrogenase Mo-binding subunit
MLDREAENLAVGNRNATRQHIRIGAKRDGTLTVLTADIQQQVGAYMVGGEASNVSGPYQRLYRCPNVRTEARGVYTNAGPAVAFRAPGFVEGAFALESAIDELARALQIDPVDLRSCNYAHNDQLRERSYTTPESLRRYYERASEAFGWRTYQRPPADGPKRRGIGFAAHDWGGSGYPPAYAWVKVIGEPPLIPTAPAIANTVFDAVGVRLRHAPLSRHGLLEALAEYAALQEPSAFPVGGRYGEGSAIAVTPAPHPHQRSEDQKG